MCAEKNVLCFLMLSAILLVWNLCAIFWSSVLIIVINICKSAELYGREKCQTGWNFGITRREILWLVRHGHLKWQPPFLWLLSLLQTMARASAILVWYRQEECMVICNVTHEEINLDTSLYCCQTVCVVYIITCQGCRHQYIDKATITLDICHCSHRSEMVE